MGKGAKKEKEQPEESNRTKQARMHEFTERFRIVGATVWRIAACGFAFGAVHSLAGADTTLKAVIEATFSGSINEWAFRGACLLLAGGASTGWYRSNKLRKEEVRELSAHVKILEKVIDPDRSSSGLNRDGNQFAEGEIVEPPKKLGSGKK